MNTGMIIRYGWTKACNFILRRFAEIEQENDDCCLHSIASSSLCPAVPINCPVAHRGREMSVYNAGSGKVHGIETADNRSSGEEGGGKRIRGVQANARGYRTFLGEIAKQLATKAMENGSVDNISVVIVLFEY